MLSAAIFLSIGSDALQAQQSADPAQIERRIEETKPDIRRAEPEIGVPEAPSAAPRAPSDKEEHFILAAVVVDGATVFDPALFAPFYEDLLAREVTLADVETILAKITGMYRDAGYILSRAVAPPQDLVAGVLHIEVIEGYIDQVDYKGVENKRALLEPYAARIKAERPLRISTLERYVLLINDISGIGIDPKLRPVQEDEGRYALVLDVGYKGADALAFLNNRGTPSAGRLQGWTSVGFNSVFGLAERIQFGFFTTPNQPEELLYFEGSYTQPIGSDGIHVSAVASVSDLDSGSELDATEVESGATRVQLSAWYPIVRRSKRSLWLTGMLHYQDFRETSFDRTITADRLRVARLRLNYWQSHHNGSTNVSLEASQGLNVLDATEQNSTNLSRADGRSDFTKANLFVGRTQGLTDNIGLQFNASAQWSAQPLLSSEEFALGGTGFGRAYDFSEVTGDLGAAASVELRYGKNLGKPWLNAYQVYAFYDIGSVWNTVSGVGEFRESISSTGAGARLTLNSTFRLALEAAKPLTRFVNTRDSTAMRYFFNLTASF